MLIYTGKFEDLKKYGYEIHNDWSTTYDKCINGYFLDVEITFKEPTLRDRCLGYRCSKDIAGEIKLASACGTNYWGTEYLSDEECKKYIQDLIEAGLVVQCELLNSTLKNIVKLQPKYNYDEAPNRKDRGVA